MVGNLFLPFYCFFIFIFINIHFCLFLLKKNKKIKLHSLFEVNLEVADSILGYLNYTLGKGLFFKKNEQ